MMAKILFISLLFQNILLIGGLRDRSSDEEEWLTSRRHRHRWSNDDDDNNNRNVQDYDRDYERVNNKIIELPIRMPGVSPKKAEEYLCKYVEAPRRKNYIVKIEAVASMKTAHHILVFACKEPGRRRNVWDCGREPECSGDSQQILYAWAKNAKPLKLPKDVGFPIGGKRGLGYIVMQVHYARALKPHEKDESGVTLHITERRLPKVAGILLFVSSDARIPPHTKGYHSDMYCKYESKQDITPFAYRTHTHALGRSVSAYVIKNDKWFLIGIGNPQRPQAFYPIPKEKRITIEHNDHMAARCTFDSARDRTTSIGGTSADEMCNFYMMYYTDNRKPVNQKLCFDGEPPRGLYFPEGSDQLPQNLKTVGHAHFHMPGDGNGSHMQSRPTSMENTLSKGAHLEEKISVKGGTDFESNLDNLIEDDRTLVVDGKWPYSLKEYENIGEVSAVGVASDGDVVFFHRGPRQWKDDTFDEHYRLRPDIEPIKVPTVYHVNHKSGKIVKKWGDDLFYIPHGLTIDSDDNIWLTDVGAHQVFKFNRDNVEVPALTLGRALIPGNGRHHFCQPSDVAVEKSGVFYVADGYCNSRIMKFSSKGELLLFWGRRNSNMYAKSRVPGEFSVPHSLAIDEAKKLLFVADRENGRIQCFSTDGNYNYDIVHREFDRIFAVSFSPANGGILYAINNPSNKKGYPEGFTLKAKSGKIVGRWSPIVAGFSQPHDVCHSRKENAVYVTETGPNRVWKFIKRVVDTKEVKPEKILESRNDTAVDVSVINALSDPSVIPAVVVVVVLATPISLICIAAVIQHLRLKHKRTKAIRKRDQNSNLSRDRGCMFCCYTPKYYYDSKRGFDKLIGELSDSEDDLFAKGST